MALSREEIEEKVKHKLIEKRLDERIKKREEFLEKKYRERCDEANVCFNCGGDLITFNKHESINIHDILTKEEIIRYNQKHGKMYEALRSDSTDAIESLPNYRIDDLASQVLLSEIIRYNTYNKHTIYLKMKTCKCCLIAYFK